nr:type II CRISPR RNA-guided endonuclease Cas9 [Roseobacter sp. HKCCA0434]
MRRLADAGLMPEEPAERKDLELLDPFELRARGLDSPLTRTELGRAIFHLNQRRGFKSNRKADRGDNEDGLIRLGTARLDQAMLAAGVRTYGEFLYKRRAAASDPRQVPSVRTRLTVQVAPDGKTTSGYDHYPSRFHLEEEFRKLWAAQQRFDPDLSDELGEALFETIFYQRPLKAPKMGRCRYLDEPRLPKAHPAEQQRVLYETINALRVAAPGKAARALTIEERDRVALALNGKKPPKSPGSAAVTFKALAKVLKLQDEERFTHETFARDAIACDAVLMSLAHPDRFGVGWTSLSMEAQWDLICRIRAVETDEERSQLVDWLRETHGLSEGRAAATADAPLPQGYGRLGETAVCCTLEKLRQGQEPDGTPLVMSRAVEEAGLPHHSDDRTGEVLANLPYYGAVLERHVIPGSNRPEDPEVERFGRITNPTVHIALNQLRRLVNRIIERYGKPEQVVLELSRDLKNGEQRRREIEVEIKRNTDAAIRRGAQITEMSNGRVLDTGANRLVMRLWEELGPDVLSRRCPYSGQQISFAMLWDGSCDVDHILPYSRTLDDSPANKTLCLREANREKRNRTPYEMWGTAPDRWSEIQANLPNVPANKRWRFAPDAMERFEGDRFFDRQLVDTQYLSRIARTYLDTLFTEGGHVWVVTGRTTEMLRRHWGLNGLLSDHNRAAKEKNRTDHRHHAIDAAVIAATDRSLVKRLADAADVSEAQGREDVVQAVAPPWPTFRDDLGHVVDRIIVSHRPDHGRVEPGNAQVTASKLHNDTAYGLGLRDGDGNPRLRNGIPLVVTRKPLESLKPNDLSKVAEVDPHLANLLKVATRGKDGKDFTAALADFSRREGPYHGLRRVRIAIPVNVVAIADREGRPYKGYDPDSNQRYEVWRMPDGKPVAWVVRTFDAHQPGEPPRPHPAAKRLLRLHQNDLVALDDSKFGPVVAKVEMFDQSGKITLAPHSEANVSERYRRKEGREDLYLRFMPRTLLKAGARRVHVDETGHIRDPGPPR